MELAELIDLEKYPLDRLDADQGLVFMETCRASFAKKGYCSMPGFVRELTRLDCVKEMNALFPTAYRQDDDHNVYFSSMPPPVACSHPARQTLHTAKWCVPADQLENSIIDQIYGRPEMIDFVARLMGHDKMYLHEDPLAKLNVHYFDEGDQLDWHFDRAHFTVTVLLQKPDAGGEFQVRQGLRTDDNPNYHGVGLLLSGDDPKVEIRNAPVGTLTIFAGHYAAHKVTPIEGNKQRILATLSYEPTPGVAFKPEDRAQFYGRSE